MTKFLETKCPNYNLKPTYLSQHINTSTKPECFVAGAVLEWFGLFVDKQGSACTLRYVCHRFVATVLISLTLSCTGHLQFKESSFIWSWITFLNLCLPWTSASDWLFLEWWLITWTLHFRQWAIILHQIMVQKCMVLINTSIRQFCHHSIE